MTHATAASNALVVAVHGEVDLRTVPRLRDELMAHLRQTGPRLIVDLTEVGFLGASGLTVLLAVREAAVAKGTTLFLVAHARPVLRLLTVAGLDGVFDVEPDLARALTCPAGPDR
ncbi:STAS domain-containing protein [Actinokineospora sp. HUAS TT18]|uniref:STAS domain-containing protein n=1 Tax=Actinokineospora sp. HUAS TT18 TaxID=3447451 RepID=UPI003F525C03